MQKITFSCYEHDIIYILNCICLTKDILKTGKKENFEHYFKKELYNTYMFDLTIIQKLIGYKANRVFYNFKNRDFFIGQFDYISEGDREFNFLFGKQRLERLREIEQEIKYIENLEKSKKYVEKQKNNNNYFNKSWFLRVGM